MFDLSIPELLVVAVVALLVIGPKDLPRSLHALGVWIGKVKNLADEFRRYVDDAMREVEMDEFHRNKILNYKTLITGSLEETNSTSDGGYHNNPHSIRMSYPSEKARFLNKSVSLKKVALSDLSETESSPKMESQARDLIEETEDLLSSASLSEPPSANNVTAVWDKEERDKQ